MGQSKQKTLFASTTAAKKTEMGVRSFPSCTRDERGKISRQWLPVLAFNTTAIKSGNNDKAALVQCRCCCFPLEGPTLFAKEEEEDAVKIRGSSAKFTPISS